jgi:mannose-6-phosphate isomerase-like protein (cupin superfamily)
MQPEPGQIYHGGAMRLAIRWPNAPDEPPHRVSRYEVAPEQVCTRHVHTGKAETWIIVAGTGVAVIGDQRVEVSPGDALFTPPGTAHSLHNTGTEPLQFLNLVTITGDAPVTTTELAD